MNQITEEIQLIKLGNVYGDFNGGNYAGNVFDKTGIAPTLTNMQGGADNQ